MTGPEHYKKAESLVDLAAKTSHASELTELTMSYTAQAQVHATLALAAAVAANEETEGWLAVLTDDQTGGTR